MNECIELKKSERGREIIATIKKGDKSDQSTLVDRDAELMLEFQHGSRQAFDELVKRNLNNVHSLVYRFMRNSNMVDDITQEAFLRIYSHGSQYKPSAKFSTWLYRIVANLCFNAMRSNKKNRTLQIDNSSEDDRSYMLEDTSVRSPEQDIDDRELADKIAYEISKLPDSQRMAIILRQYHDKNYDQIAEVMDTTVPAVKSLISRARMALREKLGRYLAVRD